MIVLRKCLIALALIAPTLAACDGADGPTITDEWRTKAAEDLLRKKVVHINESIIEKHTSSLSDRDTRLFIEATLNEFNQCIAFRKAQADAMRYKDLGDTNIYDVQMHNIERHRDHFLEASRHVLDGQKQSSGLIASANAETVKHMHQIQPDRISRQQEYSDINAKEYAQWQNRCGKMEDTLKSDVEAQAHLRLTPIEIEVRAHKLAANQK